MSDATAVLLPYQVAWFEESASVAVIEKGRRVGISWTEAAACAMHSAEDRGNCYYQSFNRDMTRGWIAKVGDWLARFEVAASIIEEREEPDPENPENKVLAYRIRLANGRRIEAIESSPRAIRSKGDPGDRYVLDEAAFVGPGVSLSAQKEHLGEVLKSALAVPMWGGQVRIISTHNGEENPFNELVQDARDARVPWSHHRVTLDDAITQGLVERINAVSGKNQTRPEFRDECFAAYPNREAAEEELMCVPRRSSGAYLPRWLVESCMSDAGSILRFDGDKAFNAAPPLKRQAQILAWLLVEVAPALERLHRSRIHAFGFDFARSGHLSVLAPIELEGRHRRCPLLVEFHNVPHAQQAEAICFVVDRLPRFGGGAMDATGAGGAVAEAVADRYGSQIEQVTISLAWYREWMPHYKGLLESQSISIPRGDEVLDDHRAVELVHGVPKITTGSQGRHGDSVAALALGCQAAAANRGPVTAAFAGRRVSTDEWQDSYLHRGDGVAAGFAGWM